MINKIKITQYCLLAFLFLCGIVIVVNVFNMKKGILAHIDAPTHFFGGTVVAMLWLEWSRRSLLSSLKSKPINRIIFMFAFLAFFGFGWEAVEILAFKMGWSPGTLFEETNENRISDLFFGLLGFIFLLAIEVKNVENKNIKDA